MLNNAKYFRYENEAEVRFIRTNIHSKQEITLTAKQSNIHGLSEDTYERGLK